MPQVARPHCFGKAYRTHPQCDQSSAKQPCFVLLAGFGKLERWPPLTDPYKPFRHLSKSFVLASFTKEVQFPPVFLP